MIPTLLRPRLALLGIALGLFVGLETGCLPSVDGFAHPTWFWARQMDWLTFATQSPANANSSPTHILAHMERAKRDPNYALAPDTVAPDAWDGTFDKMFQLRDTSDFDALRLVDLLYAHGGNPAVPQALWDEVEQTLLDFKYWYTDPTPVREFGGQPVVDNMWYWTENHVLIFKVVEYLMGQRYPDAIFSVSGQDGDWHKERAEGLIRSWLAERALLGFTEWHSNVYYNLDIRPLLVLIEWADDPDLVRRASMVLDLVLLDVALHLHKGTFGATHGRSYIKDKPSATKEDTFGAARMLFEDTVFPYQSAGNSTTAVLAHARRYRLPEVIRRIATYDAPMVDRERMNLPLDEAPPDPPDISNPPAPYGWDYRDEAYLPFWWTMGAQSVWQLVPMTLVVGNRENLWDAQFSDFKALRDLVWNPDNPDLDNAILLSQILLKGLWPLVNQAVLKEVNTYTYRTADYMLSTAVDYRKGVRGSQTHTWQATLDENAMVFTNHPGYLPVAPGDPIPPDWNWQREDEPGPGYWTGEGAQPRSAQHENVGISIYAPQYLPIDNLGFPYRDETHAYFPVAHFDDVTRDGAWTFGRKGDAYVALYSWRPVAWRGGQPEVNDNGGLDFDLVAEGGANNVWIVELGSLSEFPGGYSAFQDAFDESLVTVTPTALAFDVVYESPSQGVMTLGWEGPLNVAGVDHDLKDYPRFDNPFVQTAFEDTRYEISDGEYSLVLDFTDLEDESQDVREASAPPGNAATALAMLVAVWNQIQAFFAAL